jgi:hypothetical protein
MNISTLAGALWAASFVGHAALLLVLVTRRRWKIFRFFTAFIAFNVVRTVILFFAYRFGTPVTYWWLYWGATVLDLILQILVILEVLRIVLQPAEVWAEDARKKFRIIATGGVLPAIGLAFAIRHRIPHTPGGWIDLGQLFSVSLAVVLLLAMVASTTALGLVWRRHVAALALGWAAWNFTSFFVEGAFSYYGPRWHGVDLDNVRIVIYELATVFWIVMFWIPEPKKGTLAPEQREYLLRLQEDAEAQARALGEYPKH